MLNENRLERNRRAQAALEQWRIDGEQRRQLDKFIRSLRESRRGNLYTTTHKGRSVCLEAGLVMVFRKGNGWSWSISNDDCILYSQHEYDTADEAAAALLEVLEGGAH
jgi:hypothetical protein